jgi:hypothetical protein
LLHHNRSPFNEKTDLNGLSSGYIILSGFSILNQYYLLPVKLVRLRSYSGLFLVTLSSLWHLIQPVKFGCGVGGPFGLSG